jgi:hypothetical protein
MQTKAKQIQQSLAVLVLTLGSAAALAGLVQEPPVTVTLNPDASGNAAGSMASARFSKDDVEFIGCGVRRIDNGAGGLILFGFCQAADAANVQGFCTTENPGLLQSIGDIDDFSFITFSWNAAGECRSIGSSTQSFYIHSKK